ncbi:tRNA 2-thiouridine(34) synthase MnmA [Enterovirga sp. GCM10030262]|uniref:tRNA 2-thiouridine(34) synthase MnmA n=1 Tax=Enterovirga sp. GCM10030262 TaxID=3273391 RepID=UPI00360F0C14
MIVDFQLDRPLNEARIVVAMSGGVDSSVVAALAARTGAEVIGVTLQLYDHGAAVQRTGSCCAGQDIYDARVVADRLGIAHYVFDYESRFRDSVIERFADEYMKGRTPIPCISCNQGVKFTDLLSLARDLGADCLATGHYVRRVVGPNGVELHRAADPARDQSYFLFATKREQLDYLRFPLGDMPKPAVREIARELGLLVADKPDSQDICFVPDGDYASIVKKVRPDAAAEGEIVDRDGRVLGRHPGLIHFTVGQRRGLEIGGQPEPLYVVRLEPESRRVVVGPKAALAVGAARLGDINWLGEDQREGLTAKVRSMAKPAPVRLDGPTIRFAAPEYGVAPGQAAVLYDGDRVLGGGWIEETLPADTRSGADRADSVPGFEKDEATEAVSA